jgi:hypothetical protein
MLCDTYILHGATQRFALAAGGRAWILLWEQRKLEARKMLENAAESHTSGARFVGRGCIERHVFHYKSSFFS